MSRHRPGLSRFCGRKKSVRIQVALLGGDDALPIPLVDISGVVVVEEIVFAHGAHVGANAFSRAALELFKSHSFPFGGSLYDLGVDGMFVAVVRDVELNRVCGSRRDRACR